MAFDLTVVDHCEDLHLAEGGCMNEGVISTELGLPGIPGAAEDVMVARNLSLSELTGAQVQAAAQVREVRREPRFGSHAAHGVAGIASMGRECVASRGLRRHRGRGGRLRLRREPCGEGLGCGL